MKHKTNEYTIAHAAPILRTGEATKIALFLRFWSKFSSQTNIKCPVEKNSAQGVSGDIRHKMIVRDIL
jgi:hypothetical protein